MRSGAKDDHGESARRVSHQILHRATEDDEREGEARAAPGLQLANERRDTRRIGEQRLATANHEDRRPREYAPQQERAKRRHERQRQNE